MTYRPENTPEDKTLVLQEQLTVMHRQAPTALLMSLSNALILTIVLWPILPQLVLLSWFGAFALVIALRWYFAQCVLNRLPECSELQRCCQLFRLGAFCTAGLWGAASGLLFPTDSAQHQAFLAIILVGTTAGGLPTLSWVRGIFMPYLLLMLVPFALIMLWQGTLISIMIALLTGLYILLLRHSSLTFYTATTESIRLRFENQTLATELSRTNQDLQAEQAALKKAQSSYQDIFESVNEGIYLSLPEGKPIRVNPAMFKLNGYEREEELLNGVNDIAKEWYVDPQRREEFIRLLETDGQVENFVSEIYRHKTRERVWVSENARAVFDDDGNILLIQGTVRNITEQKRAEQALIEAKETAETAARLKSEFLATVSHELRTPLHGILGMTELLQTTELDDKQQHYAAIVKRSGDLLLRIINDILDFSKIEAGKLRLEPAPFSLEKLLRELHDDFHDRAQEKKLEFTLTIANELPAQVVADRARLQQILNNLLSNAIKFTAQGRVELSVRTQQADTKTLLLYCAVRDTGLGIAVDAQARIFESFVQVDGSLTRAHQGTGLGLSISKQLVEMMGGQLELDSEPGVGSTFSFTVRLAHSCAEAETGLATNTQSEQDLRSSFQRTP